MVASNLADRKFVFYVTTTISSEIYYHKHGSSSSIFLQSVVPELNFYKKIEIISLFILMLFLNLLKVLYNTY